MKPVTIDPVTKALPWLQICGPCDFGVHTECTCPQGDYRAVIQALVDRVLQLESLTASMYRALQ